MTEEERNHEMILALGDYQRAYKDRKSYEARISRIIEALNSIAGTLSDPSVGSDGQHFVHYVPMGIPTARPVDYYPSWGDIMEAMVGRDKAREREEEARKRASMRGPMWMLYGVCNVTRRA